MQNDAENALIQWFKKNHEQLPWRLEPLSKKRSAYVVWISEIMLQQTQVASVKAHFLRWIQKFPNITELAKAKESTVLKFWQGLGYYSRAKNILKTAKIIKEKYNEKFPETRQELEALPGIGSYTAGAILSLAFHQNEAILDGNLIRIFSRFYALDFLPENAEQKKNYWNKAKSWAANKYAFLKNEALMELGRNICKVKNPKCAQCPLRPHCVSFLQNKIESRPPKKLKLYTPWYGVIFIAKSKDKKFLISEGSSFFLKNQKTFPHFSSSPSRAKGIPAEVDKWLQGAEIKTFRYGANIEHSITRYKIFMQTLFLEIKNNAPKTTHWISEKELFDLPSSLCKKVLQALEINPSKN